MKIMKQNSAFTLVEIMMVVLILSLLVGIAVLAMVQFKKQAEEAACQANLKSIAAGFETYAAANGGVYAPDSQTPSNLQFLVDAKCLNQDFTQIGQLGNFNYVIPAGGVTSTGYTVQALAANTALSEYDYEIVTGGTLLRSPPGQGNFQGYAQ